jgi:hypothetical protein
MNTIMYVTFAMNTIVYFSLFALSAHCYNHLTPSQLRLDRVLAIENQLKSRTTGVESLIRQAPGLAKS